MVTKFPKHVTNHTLQTDHQVKTVSENVTIYYKSLKHRLKNYTNLLIAALDSDIFRETSRAS